MPSIVLALAYYCTLLSTQFPLRWTSFPIVPTALYTTTTVQALMRCVRRSFPRCRYICCTDTSSRKSPEFYCACFLGFFTANVYKYFPPILLFYHRVTHVLSWGNIRHFHGSCPGVVRIGLCLGLASRPHTFFVSWLIIFFLWERGMWADHWSSEKTDILRWATKPRSSSLHSLTVQVGTRVRDKQGS